MSKPVRVRVAEHRWRKDNGIGLFTVEVPIRSGG
jgi:hypothetical protein